jgi:polyisoprenoid-binding protein YceI
VLYKFKLSNALLGLMLLAGIVVLPYMKNEEKELFKELINIPVIDEIDQDEDQNEEEKIVLKEEVKVEVDSLKTQVKIVPKVDPTSLELVKGVWTCIPEKSVISFELGPKGSVTEGAIKNIQGSFTIPDKVGQSSFDVIIQVKELTTFNEYRDESLMEDSWLKSSAFPEMHFSSKSLVRKGELYKATGKFEMIGNTNNQTITFKYMGKGTFKGKETIILAGNAIIDRTLYGMESDSKIGNSVSFNFKIELMK